MSFSSLATIGCLGLSFADYARGRTPIPHPLAPDSLYEYFGVSWACWLGRPRPQHHDHQPMSGRGRRGRSKKKKKSAPGQLCPSSTPSQCLCLPRVMNSSARTFVKAWRRPWWAWHASGPPRAGPLSHTNPFSVFSFPQSLFSFHRRLTHAYTTPTLFPNHTGIKSVPGEAHTAAGTRRRGCKQQWTVSWVTTG